MCYKLKTLFMKKMIAKKQKKNPFDYEASESFSLSAEDDWTQNNSYYFSAHGKDQSFYCRLGIRNCHSEVWFYYSDTSGRYVLKDMLYKENCPLKIYKENSIWKIEFVGMLTDDKGKNVEARMLSEFASDEAPIDFFTNMPPIRTAKAMAAEKWSKQFFAQVQSNNQVHYEQIGRLSGKLIIDEKNISLDLPCVRDHSYGKRDWNYMNNHLWLMAVNENSQLNFSMVSYPAMTKLEVGNFKAPNKPMAYMIDATYDRAAVAGNIPDFLELKLLFDDKSALDVKVKKTDDEVYLFQDGDYCLIEGIAEIKVGEENFRGILEVGFNKDKARLFNGKKIKDLLL